MLSLKRKNLVEHQNEEEKDIHVNNNNIMTDDENSDDEEIPIQNKTPQSSVKNRILSTLSSDSADTPENNHKTDSDRTCCSLLENVDKLLNEKRDTEIYEGTSSLFSDSEKSFFNGEFINNRLNYPVHDKNTNSVSSKSVMVDTVVGSFTDEDLIFSRLSDLKIQDPTQNENDEYTPTVADTVVGSFTDDDLLFSELKKKNVIEYENKDRLSTLADTVVGPFTDEDLIYSHLFESQNQSHVSNKKLNNEPGLSTNASKNEQKKIQMPQARVMEILCDNKHEANDSDCSSSEEEVISILDSDDELDDFSAELPQQKESGSFVNCSNITTKFSSKTSTLSDSVNTFFNNPPAIKSNEIAVSHTMIRDFRNNISDFDDSLDIVETSIEDRFVRSAKYEDVIINESIDINETSDNDNNDDTSINVETAFEKTNEKHEINQDSKDLPRKQSEIQKKSTQTDKRHKETLKIKGRINLEIKFKFFQTSSSNSSYNDDDDDYSDKSSTTSEPSPRRNERNTSARSSAKTKPTKKIDHSPTKNPGSASFGKAGPSSVNKPTPASGEKINTPINTKKSLVKQSSISTTPVSRLPQKATKTSSENPAKNKLNLFEESTFATPVKDNDIEIDEAMEALLNTLYGEEWKTPSLLQSCKSRKFQKSVRKSMALSNFGACKYSLIIIVFRNIYTLILVSRNLPKDLESTRISITTEENNAIISNENPEVKIVSSPYFEKKPQKKITNNVVESNKKMGKSSKYHPLCDTDTEDSDSSEDNFQPNETWNASCSDENTDDDINDFVIKKRTLKSNVNRKPPVFQHDPETFSRNKEKEFDEMLDRFEYKKPLQIETPSSTFKTKRKLFTHSYYDLEKNEPLLIEKEVDNKENNIKTTNIWNQPFPFQNKKLDQVKNIESEKSSTLTPSTPKTVVKKKIKPSPLERVQTPKVALEIIDKFQKDRFTNFSFLKSLDVTLNKSLCHPEALMYREHFKLKKQELTEKLFKLYNEKVFDNRLDVPLNW